MILKIYIFTVIKGDLNMVTVLATFAVIAFLVTNIKKYHGGKITSAVAMSKQQGMKSALAAGIVTANGLMHFIHGIFGYVDFPAPFAKMFGHGLPADIANVLWGLFNLMAAILLVIRCRKSLPKWQLILLILTAAFLMFLLLRFVLLKGYFNTHLF